MVGGKINKSTDTGHLWSGHHEYGSQGVLKNRFQRPQTKKAMN